MKCKYCDGTMSLAWPGAKGKGKIYNCDKCRATCLSDGRKTWDWRPGK